MFLSGAASALLTFSFLSVAAPVDAIALGSKHNLYLATCVKKSILDCPLPIICSSTPRYTAVAYYANGPITSSVNSTPTSITTVTDPAWAWEGIPRVAQTGQAGLFSSEIDAGASVLPKGQIAGDAKLGSEDFACFVDGQTTFSGRSDLIGLDQWACTANYWCASIAVSK